MCRVTVRRSTVFGPMLSAVISRLPSPATSTQRGVPPRCSFASASISAAISAASASRRSALSSQSSFVKTVT